MNSKEKKSTLALISWAFFDWANSSYSAVIQTFVFAAYFIRHVSANETEGVAQWGIAIGTAGMIVAIGGPTFGAIADQGKKRKIWLFLFTYMAIISTALMWFILPSPEYTLPALLLLSIGTIGNEYSSIFYNAMLPLLAPRDMIGRWSGWGWGLGYVGGLCCLLIALFVFLNDYQSLLHLKTYDLENVRAIFLLVAVWFLIFSLPIFLFTPKFVGQGKPPRQAIRDGFHQLYLSLLNIRRYKEILRFLIAHLFYADGLATLFAFGGIYAAGEFNMNEEEVLLFGITLNITAGIGAGLMAFVDDKIGSKKTILISLLNLIFFTGLIFITTSKIIFWVIGAFIGIFVGPVQASSRSLLARMIPEKLLSEMFGFYALSGKATAFVGPLLVSSVTYLFNDERAGILVILAFFIIGAALLGIVTEQTEQKKAELNF